MPQRTQHTRRRLTRLLLFSLATWAFLALGRTSRTRDAALPEAESRPESVPGWASSPAPSLAAGAAAGRRRATRRLAASFAFAVLFFAGASFSALGGDTVAKLMESDPAWESAPAELAEEAPLSEPETAPEPAPEPAPESAPEPEPAPEPAPGAAEELELIPAPAEPTAPDPAPAADELEAAPVASAASRAPAAKSTPRKPAAQPSPQPVRPLPSVEQESHAHAHAGEPTVWLHRALPDPTPPSLRLAPELAEQLRRTARRHGLEWSYLLAVLRADGRRVSTPARLPTMAETAARLAKLNAKRDPWGAALAVHGRTPAADRAVALSRYYRAIGLGALVRGLQAERKALAKRLLADERVQIYGGGREDIAADRVDVRVLALIAYLAESYDQVTVSSLITGHRLYAAPGRVSAHVYGHAVDIAALGGRSIAGNSQPGGLTEQAVRDILFLPREVLPRQVISLLGLGGPSFPLGDHGDHIHVGY